MNIKIFKYIVNIFIIIAVLLEINTILAVYIFLNSMAQRIGTPIPLAILATAITEPIVYIIAYLLGIILIIKDKKIGYLISGIISLLIFGNSIQQVLQNSVKITSIMTITSIFWIVLITMSFIAYYKLVNLKKIK